MFTFHDFCKCGVKPSNVKKYLQKKFPSGLNRPEVLYIILKFLFPKNTKKPKQKFLQNFNLSSITIRITLEKSESKIDYFTLKKALLVLLSIGTELIDHVNISYERD